MDLEHPDFSSVIDGITPRHCTMAGLYKRSFAYYTLTKRYPIIIQNIVDSLIRSEQSIIYKHGDRARLDIRSIVYFLTKLKIKVTSNVHLEFFSKVDNDETVWNDFLSQLPPAYSTFFQICFLYAECYIYRRIYSHFQSTKCLRRYDYFQQNKTNALHSSVTAIISLFQSIKKADIKNIPLHQIVELSLWGNAFDLSFSDGENIVPKSNIFESIKSMKSKVIVDESGDILKCVIGSHGESENIVDIICDNAGYELITDFVLAEYLLENSMAKRVRFHVKAIPWFISDVTVIDFHYTLKFLYTHAVPILREKGQQWVKYLDEGKFHLKNVNQFWTLPYEYYKMRELAPALYKELSEAVLLIFKGDLNYRKLVCDFNWDSTEFFVTCLRGFQPTNICALRVIKSDVLCGLFKGQGESLSSSHKNWTTSGQYAVIQFSECSNCECVL